MFQGEVGRGPGREEEGRSWCGQAEGFAVVGDVAEEREAEVATCRVAGYDDAVGVDAKGVHQIGWRVEGSTYAVDNETTRRYRAHMMNK